MGCLNCLTSSFMGVRVWVWFHRTQLSAQSKLCGKTQLTRCPENISSFKSIGFQRCHVNTECSFYLLIYLLSFPLLENLKWFCNLKSQGNLPNYKLPWKVKHLGLKQKLIYSNGSQVLSATRNPGISQELARNASSQPTPDLHWKLWVGPRNLCCNKPFKCNKAFKEFWCSHKREALP